MVGVTVSRHVAERVENAFVGFALPAHPQPKKAVEEKGNDDRRRDAAVLVAVVPPRAAARIAKVYEVLQANVSRQGMSNRKVGVGAQVKEEQGN